MKGDNGTALPLLSLYSLISGFTLSGLQSYAIQVGVLPIQPIPMPVLVPSVSRPLPRVSPS